MSINLSDARDKLDRGRYHIDQLDQMIAAYLSSSFYEIVFDPNARTLILKSLHQPDKQINATLGDAVGNLRSVLDYIINAVLEPITGKSDATFPFADDRPGWEGEVSKGYVSAAPQSVKDILIEEVQGYKGGRGEVLWQLNKLRNIDKHRLLIVTTNTAGVRIWGTINGTVRMNGATISGRAGHDQNLIAGIDHAVFDKNPEPVFRVSICEPKIGNSVEVLRFLQSAASDVTRVLDAFQNV